MFYFSILAYLYSWWASFTLRVRILVKSYENNLRDKSQYMRLIIGGLFIILTLLFLFGLIYSYVTNDEDAKGNTPRQ